MNSAMCPCRPLRGALVRDLQPALRACLHYCHQQSAVRRVDRRIRLRAVDRRAARSTDPPRPHPGNERRQLSPQTEQTTSAPDVKTRLALSLPRCSLRGRSGARHARGAARGSAPPIPYAARRSLGDNRSGRESRPTDRTGKLSLAARRTAAPVMHFYSGAPMHLLSGVDSPIFHKTDAGIRGHVFCTFLALILRKELLDRLAA